MLEAVDRAAVQAAQLDRDPSDLEPVLNAITSLVKSQIKLLLRVRDRSPGARQPR